MAPGERLPPLSVLDIAKARLQKTVEVFVPPTTTADGWVAEFEAFAKKQCEEAGRSLVLGESWPDFCALLYYRSTLHQLAIFSPRCLSKGRDREDAAPTLWRTLVRLGVAYFAAVDAHDSNRVDKYSCQHLHGLVDALLRFDRHEDGAALSALNERLTRGGGGGRGSGGPVGGFHCKSCEKDIPAAQAEGKLESSPTKQKKNTQEEGRLGDRGGAML